MLDSGAKALFLKEVLFAPQCIVGIGMVKEFGHLHFAFKGLRTQILWDLGLPLAMPAKYSRGLVELWSPTHWASNLGSHTSASPFSEPYFFCV